MKNNTYFAEMKRIDHEWEAARVERQSRKHNRWIAKEI